MKHYGLLLIFVEMSMFTILCGNARKNLSEFIDILKENTKHYKNKWQSIQNGILSVRNLAFSDPEDRINQLLAFN